MKRNFFVSGKYLSLFVLFVSIFLTAVDLPGMALVPTPLPDRMAIPFMPVSEREFAGYRIDTGIISRLGFKLEEKGNFLGVAVPGKEGVTAHKENKQVFIFL